MKQYSVYITEYLRWTNWTTVVVQFQEPLKEVSYETLPGMEPVRSTPIPNWWRNFRFVVDEKFPKSDQQRQQQNRGENGEDVREKNFFFSFFIFFNKST